MKKFKLGDLVVCEVIEILNVSEIIVSFKGELMRVQNLSYRSLRVGEFIHLIVQGIEPLQFKLFAQRPGFDRSI